MFFNDAWYRTLTSKLRLKSCYPIFWLMSVFCQKPTETFSKFGLIFFEKFSPPISSFVFCCLRREDIRHARLQLLWPISSARLRDYFRNEPSWGGDKNFNETSRFVIRKTYNQHYMSGQEETTLLFLCSRYKRFTIVFFMLQMVRYDSLPYFHLDVSFQTWQHQSEKKYECYEF